MKEDMQACPVRAHINTLPKDERERLFERIQDIAGTPFILYLLLCSCGYEGGFEPVESFLVENGYRRNPCRALADQAEKLEEDIKRTREQMEQGQAGVVPMRPGEGERALSTLIKEMRGCLVEADRIGKRLDRAGLMLAGADLLSQELLAVFDATDEAAIKAITTAFANVAAGVAEMD